MATTQWLKRLEIPGRVLFSEGSGELSKLEIDTAWSNAEIYLHGAHLTHFQRKGEPPLLFMSQLSRYAEGSPIRGGIPIIFPWFGPREGQPAHGFARTQTWELREVAQLPLGEVRLRLGLPDSAQAASFPKFAVEYAITVGKTLTAELTVANRAPEADFTFENCLHTYFNISDINAITVTGLRGAAYLDQTENFARKAEQDDYIRISKETDRIYLDTAAAVEIEDPNLRRKIRIAKTGSRSTVLWNPWVEKSGRMPDFGDAEFNQMICVESGNVSENRLTLKPGETAILKVEISALSF